MSDEAKVLIAAMIMIVLISLFSAIFSKCSFDYDVQRESPVYIIGDRCDELGSRMMFVRGDLELCVECDFGDDGRLIWTKYCCEE